jgi:3-phosphoinositide dependent protein kinase-1
MFTSKLPFKGIDQEHTFDLIKKCQYEIPKDVPADVKDIIEKILVKNPMHRLGAANINDLMMHSFFKGINWNTISYEYPPM